jgi:hypothetical protein
MAEPHTLAFPFTKRRRTGGQAVRRCRALREAVGYHQAPRERTLREPFLGTARSQLEKAKWEAALAAGRAMTFDDAGAYALEVAVRS